MNIWDLINGNVPGGVVLFIILMSVFTITWFFIVRFSPVLTFRHFKRMALVVNVIFVLVYAIIWRTNPPLIPEDRFIIGPFHTDLKSDLFLVDEVLHRMIQQSDKKDIYITDYTSVLSSLKNLDLTKMEETYSRILSRLPAKYRLSGWVRREKNAIWITLSLKKNGKTVLTQEVRYDNEGLNKIHDVFGHIPQIDLNNLDSFPPPDYLKTYIRNNLILDAAFKSEFTELHQSMWDTVQMSRYLTKQAWSIKKNEKKKDPINPVLTESDQLFMKARRPLIKLAKDNRLLADGMLALAENYILNEKYGHADAVLKQLMTLEINNYRIFYWLSFLHPSRLQEIDLKDEMEALYRAWVICPVDEHVILRYAEFLFKKSNPSSKEIDRAINLVKLWIGQNPYSIKAYLKLGYFYMYLNRLDEAEHLYSKADSVFPGNFDILMNQAILCKDRGRIKEAIQIFNRLKNVPDYEDVYLYLGDIYLQTGKYDSALMMFRKRVDLKKGENDKLYGEALKGIRRALQMKEEANAH